MLQGLLVVVGFAASAPLSALTPAAPEALWSSEDPVAPAADGRAEVAADIAKLAEIAEKRGAQALEAVAVIARMRAQFAKSGPKDRRDIAQAIAHLFETRKPAREKEAPSDPIHLAAADALGVMAPQSVVLLIGALDDKALRRDLALQRQLLLALGTTHDKRAIDPLLDRLQDKDAVLVAAAGEALGSFDGADQTTRKKLFEETLKAIVSAKGAVARIDQEQGSSSEPQPNPGGAMLVDRYETIRVPLLTTLARLAKHREDDPDAWQRWWNKNKKSDWDAKQEAKEPAKG